MLGHLKFVLRQQWRTVSHEQLRVGEVHMPLHYVSALSASRSQIRPDGCGIDLAALPDRLVAVPPTEQIQSALQMGNPTSRQRRTQLSYWSDVTVAVISNQPVSSKLSLLDRLRFHGRLNVLFRPFLSRDGLHAMAFSAKTSRNGPRISFPATNLVIAKQCQKTRWRNRLIPTQMSCVRGPPCKFLKPTSPSSVRGFPAAW